MNVADFLQHQPVLTGIAGSMGAGALLFQLRALPHRLATLLREAVGVTLVVESDDAAYRYLDLWLARHRAAHSARRLKLREGYDYDEGLWKQEMTLGFGWHLIRVGRSWVFVHRHKPQASGLDRLLSKRNEEQLTFFALGRSQNVLRELLPLAEAEFFGGPRLEVFFWHQGCFVFADRRAGRPMATVYCPEAQKTRLTDDLTRFLGQRGTYRARGTPWRRGYLLKGPPGTGKTTLIQALAYAHGRKIYSINLASVASDNDLLSAFSQADCRGFVVIEDIDTAKVTRDRGIVAAEEAVKVSLGGGRHCRRRGSEDGCHPQRLAQRHRRRRLTRGSRAVHHVQPCRGAGRRARAAWAS